MDNIDIFSDDIYNQLNQAYNQQLKPNTSCFELLNNLTQTLQTYNFQLPLQLQNQVLNNLLQAKQILNIVFIQQPTNYTRNNINNNPFSLIGNLAHLSSYLTSHTLKSPYQTLYLKTNQLVLKSIQEISNYFMNKNIKIFKFI